MSERYSRVFALPENLYAVGSPVVIAAGTLLKDNQTGRIVAQLKFRSISNKIIKAVKVRLDLFDTAGSSIAESVVFDYLDLSASRDAEFGQKTPVPVPDNKARSYKAAVTEVVFADKTIWTATDEAWEPLSSPAPLTISDPVLLKQYQLRFGSDSRYTPKEEKDLWYCTCGALNHSGENCHVCRNSLFELQTVDMAELEAEKVARLAKEAKEEAEAKAAADIQKQKNKKTLKIVATAVCAIVAIVVLMVTVVIPTMEANAEQNRLKAEYSEAVALMEAGEYESAIAAFEALGDYKDSNEQIGVCNKAIEDAAVARAEEERVAAYANAEALANNGELAKAAIAFGKLGAYHDARERSYALWSVVADWESVAMGSEYTLGLKNDGTVVATGENDYGQCDVGNWRNIIDIAAGGRHSVGLKSDGTVVAVGSNEDIYDKYVRGQCEVSAWTDIVDVCAGSYHTVGLKSDGTVVAVGSNYEATDYDTYCGQCDVTGWSDIIAISAGVNHTVGLKSDGTVVAVGSNKNGQCDVSSWSGIVAISAGNFHTVGLKSDGTVVAVGWNEWNACNVSGWRNITAIDAGYCLTVGVCEDGTVISVGKVDNKLTSMTDWNDIIDVYAGSFNAIGLTEDGTLIATGRNNKGEMNVSDWTNIKLPN